MTDFLIDNLTNDWKVENNRLAIVPDKNTLTAQRLTQRLDTFQGTRYTDLDYGVNFDLIASATNKDELDQHYKGLILEVTGVTTLQSFVSSVNEEGVYTINVEVITEDNEIIPIEYSTAAYVNPLQQEGIWYEGGFNAFGVFNNEEILGGS